jgi:Fe-S cluster assembly protein SufD
MQNKIIIKQNEEKILPILWTGQESDLSYNIHLAGNGAKLTLLALLLGKETNKINLQTNIYHNSPNTQSRVIVKGALADSASINFEGLVKIEPGAKGTNAWLAAHILLLSTQAKGRTVPSLEIAENDIKAGHATTVGRVNNLELFYLQSRGISEKTAITLIVHGFLSSILNEFPPDLAASARKQLDAFTSFI